MNYLAFDLGAESGRTILGKIDNETISLEEIHRFSNVPKLEDGHLRWDVKKIFQEIKTSLEKIDKKNTPFSGLSVDAWGVDFGLLDDQGALVANPICYRDAYTKGIMEKVFEKISKQEIYNITGIQFLPINSLYQLFAQVLKDPKNLQ